MGGPFGGTYLTGKESRKLHCKRSTTNLQREKKKKMGGRGGECGRKMRAENTKKRLHPLATEKKMEFT